MFLSERLITVRSSPNFAIRVCQRIFSSILYTKILEVVTRNRQCVSDLSEVA